MIQELGDRLVVSFRPRRAWSVLVFLSVWVTGWTFGGLMAMTQLGQVGPGGTAFLLAWLCGWVAGEIFVAGVIAWQLYGRSVLTVTTESLELRWQIGRLARSKTYDIATVEEVAAAVVPSDEDEGPRKDFGLRIVAGGETLHVGERLTATEAEYVASMVGTRISAPRSWWAEQHAPVRAAAAPAAAVLWAGATGSQSRRRIYRGSSPQSSSPPGR